MANHTPSCAAMYDERVVEAFDAEWHADQIRVQADRHDPAGPRALGVERVELAFIAVTNSSIVWLRVCRNGELLIS